jgi:nucleoside 2-deoxyribosyltransferase
MQQKNWINIKMQRTGDGRFAIAPPFFVTEEGWFEIEKDLERNFSKQVFVAMWFDDKMEKVAQKIEEAIRSCELIPMIIKKKEHNNEISGEILFEIMKSRIIIADVTGQRNGVYFEAGFALGHQKSVIWSCQKEDLKNVHFDTRQYNHIVWTNEDDLCTKLKDRLIATLAIEKY